MTTLVAGRGAGSPIALDVVPLSADAFGYAAAAITFVQLPPQVMRTVKTRDVAGLAPMMWALLLVGGAAWLLYGMQAGLVPSVVVNVLVVTCSALMLRVLVLERASGSGPAFRVATFGLPVVGMVAVLGPVGLLGALAAVAGALILWPQAVAVLRSDDLSGLSVPSVALGVVVNALWLAFGLGHANPVVWLPASQSTALAAVVLARVLLSGRAAARLGSATRTERVDPPTGPVPITI